MRYSAGMKKIIVLGVGNLLLTDEGIGVRAVEQFERQYRLPPEVQVIDGGTAGMEMLETLENLDHLIIVDCARFNRPPGSVFVLHGEEVPNFFKIKISPHQIGISDVLGSLIFVGRAPKDLSLIGIQPVLIETGMELTPEVEATIPEVVRLIVEELRTAGVELQENAPCA